MNSIMATRDFIVCGVGEVIKTLLSRQQAPLGEEIV